MWRLAVPLPEEPRVTLRLERDDYRRTNYLLFGADSESALEMYLMELDIALQETRRELARKNGAVSNSPTRL